MEPVMALNIKENKKDEEEGWGREREGCKIKEENQGNFS